MVATDESPTRSGTSGACEDLVQLPPGTGVDLSAERWRAVHRALGNARTSSPSRWHQTRSTPSRHHRRSAGAPHRQGSPAAGARRWKTRGQAAGEATARPPGRGTIQVRPRHRTRCGGGAGPPPRRRGGPAHPAPRPSTGEPVTPAQPSLRLLPRRPPACAGHAGRGAEAVIVADLEEGAIGYSVGHEGNIQSLGYGS